MDKPASNTSVDCNVTPKIYKVQCQGKAAGCKGVFETTSRFAKTCSGACRQKKWRGQVITTDAEALEETFGEKYPHSAERLQDYYQKR